MLVTLKGLRIKGREFSLWMSVVYCLKLNSSLGPQTV